MSTLGVVNNLTARKQRPLPRLWFALYGSEAVDLVPRDFSLAVVEARGRVRINNAEANYFGSYQTPTWVVDQETMQEGLARHPAGTPIFFDPTDDFALDNRPGQYRPGGIEYDDATIDQSIRRVRSWIAPFRTAAPNLIAGMCGLPLPESVSTYNYERGIEAIARLNKNAGVDLDLYHAGQVGTQVNGKWVLDVATRAAAPTRPHSLAYWHYLQAHKRLRYGLVGTKKDARHGLIGAFDVCAPQCYQFAPGTASQFGTTARGIVRAAKQVFPELPIFVTVWPKLHGTGIAIDLQLWADQMDEIFPLSPNVLLWDPRNSDGSLMLDHIAVLRERALAYSRRTA